MADPRVVNEIIRQGRGRPRKHVVAALETGIVESGLRNLHHGDADSEGWRQERKSLYPNPTNIKASVRRFYQEAQQHDRRGLNAGELAANVQRPAAQYRGRYHANRKEALKYLEKFAKGKIPGADADGGRSGLPGSSGAAKFTQTSVDQEAYEAARRKAVVGGLIAKRNPNSFLLRSGVLGTQMPSVSDFTKTTTGTAKARIPGLPAQGGRSSRGSGGGRSRAKGIARELFFKPGINVDDGHRVGREYAGVNAAPDRHTRHVHVAFDNDHDRREVMKIAREEGVIVTSTLRNTTTFHGQKLKSGKSRAVDYGGDPKAMKRFNRRVAQYFGEA